MSSTIFSGQQESGPYSTVNVLMVGVRGVVFPLLGAYLGQLWGIEVVLVLASLMCFAAATFMHFCKKVNKTTTYRAL